MRLRHLGPATLAAWAALALGGAVASAQYFGTDPYMPYARPYLPFVYPGYNTNPSLPNQSRSSAPVTYGGRGALYGGSALDRYFDEMAAATPLPPAAVGGFGPAGGLNRYDSAYRQYDQAFGRVYIPNQKADQDYQADRQKRDDLSVRALTERDPRKKADLLRQLEEANRRADRDFLVSRRRVGGRPGPSSGGEDRDDSISRRRVGGAPTRPGGAATARVAPSSSATARVTASPSTPAAIGAASGGRRSEPMPDEVLNRSYRLGGRSIPPPPDPLLVPGTGRVGASRAPSRSGPVNYPRSSARPSGSTGATPPSSVPSTR